MHDVAPVAGRGHRVVVFNPGSNPNQARLLRLVNPGDGPADVTIAGIDDRGEPAASPVLVSVPAGAARALTDARRGAGQPLRGWPSEAMELEAGGEDFDGAPGDGCKWRLAMESGRPWRS